MMKAWLKREWKIVVILVVAALFAIALTELF